MSVSQEEGLVEKTAFVLVVGITKRIKLEFTMQRGWLILEIRGIFQECQPLCLREGARARNLLAARITVSVSGLGFLVEMSATARIAVTASPTTTETT